VTTCNKRKKIKRGQKKRESGRKRNKKEKKRQTMTKFQSEKKRKN